MIEVSPFHVRLRKCDFRHTRDSKVLRDSIKAMGMVNAIHCFVADGKFTVRDGNMRVRAARKLGLKKIPICLDSRFIENLYVKGLSPAEYRRRMWIALEVHSLTQIANALGLKISEIKTVLT